MKSATIAAALAAAVLAAAQPAWAQDAMASAAQDIVSAVQPVHLRATIVYRSRQPRADAEGRRR